MTRFNDLYCIVHKHNGNWQYMRVYTYVLCIMSLPIKYHYLQHAVLSYFSISLTCSYPLYLWKFSTQRVCFFLLVQFSSNLNAFLFFFLTFTLSLCTLLRINMIHISIVSPIFVFVEKRCSNSLVCGILVYQAFISDLQVCMSTVAVMLLV